MLHDWQRDFLQALVADEQRLPAYLHALDTDGVRLAIYRNNRRANLRNVLGITYPVVAQLVGAEFFEYTADRFIDKHPSLSANLDDYGRDFPGFLREFAPASALPYLGDVAALELAIETLAATVDPDAVVQMQSAFPILKIWQSHQPDWPSAAVVDLAEGPDNLLLRIEQGEVVIENLR